MNTYRTQNYVKDKVIVITGASSGFGKETAKKAAELGGKVVLAARREHLLREIVQEIRENGGEASYIGTDVRVREQVERMIRFAVDTYGAVDVLINDAGTMPLAWFSEHEQAMAAWEQSIATAINGTLYGISAVYDQMISRGMVILSIFLLFLEIQPAPVAVCITLQKLQSVCLVIRCALKPEEKSRSPISSRLLLQQQVL